MVRVTVTLRQEHLEEVDQLADKLAIPRSAAEVTGKKSTELKGKAQRARGKLTEKLG